MYVHIRATPPTESRLIVPRSIGRSHSLTINGSCVKTDQQQRYRETRHFDAVLDEPSDVARWSGNVVGCDDSVSPTTLFKQLPADCTMRHPPMRFDAVMDVRSGFSPLDAQRREVRIRRIGCTERTQRSGEESDWQI